MRGRIPRPRGTVEEGSTPPVRPLGKRMARAEGLAAQAVRDGAAPDPHRDHHDTAPGDMPTAPRRKGGGAARKRPEMARRGNLNARKHGAYLNAGKHAAAVARDRFRRRGEREARAILAAAGLQNDPTARMVARQVGRLEAMAHRLEEWHTRRGYFTRQGELKGSVGREVEVINHLLGEARRLLEQLSTDSGTLAADGVFRIGTCSCQASAVEPRPVAAASPAVASSPLSEGEATAEKRSKPVAPSAPPEQHTLAAAIRPVSGDPAGLGWIPLGGRRD